MQTVQQCKLRETLLTASCLGDTMEYKNITKDNRENIYKRVSPGDIQDIIRSEEHTSELQSRP